MRLKPRCWALAAPLLLSACVEVELRPISGAAALPPGTKTVLLAASAPGQPLQLYSLSSPFALPVAPTPEQRLLAVALGRDLEDLDLPPGLLSDVSATGGRAVPEPLGAFVSEDGAPFVAYREALELTLPPHDWTAILGRRQCADGAYYVGKSCTASVAVQVARPALPIIRSGGACPAGWLPVAHSFSAGPTRGTLSVDLCSPPPRQACAPAELQAAGDSACVPVSPACSASDPFPLGLSRTATVVYVLAGAGAGDGSRARPFGSMAQGVAAAQRRRASALAIGRGSYPEDLSIAGALDVVGACASETTLQGSLVLSGHSGRISGLSVRAPGASVLRIAAQSTTELDGVELSATSSATLGCSIAESELLLRSSSLRLPDRGVWLLSAARVSVVDSQLHAQLYVSRSALAVSGSALTTGGGAIGVTDGSTMTVDRSYVATQVNVVRGDLDARRSWFVPGRVEGSNEQRSIYSSVSRIHLAQCTIDHREPIIREPLVAPVETQFGAEILESTKPSLIEDVVFLLHEPSAEPPRQHFIGLGLYNPISTPHLLRRVILVGGTFTSIGINTSSMRAEDLGIYRVRGTGILGPEAHVETARLEIADLRGSGVDIGGSGQATLVDTGVYDVDRTSLAFKGDGPFVARRATLACARGSAGGVHVSDARTLPVEVEIRQLSVQGPFETGLHSGFLTGLELAGFTIDGASRGLLLLGASGSRRLSYGSVRASGVGLCLASNQANLEQLLEHVGVSAPTLLERGEDR